MNVIQAMIEIAGPYGSKKWKEYLSLWGVLGHDKIIEMAEEMVKNKEKSKEC